MSPLSRIPYCVLGHAVVGQTGWSVTVWICIVITVKSISIFLCYLVSGHFWSMMVPRSVLFFFSEYYPKSHYSKNHFFPFFFKDVRNNLSRFGCYFKGSFVGLSVYFLILVLATVKVGYNSYHRWWVHQNTWVWRPMRLLLSEQSEN